jgi:ribosomal protein L40E
MPKFKEAMDRIFKNMFVCRICKSKIRADPLKVRLGLVKCRKCKSKKLRIKHKEVKGAGGGAGAAPGAAPAGKAPAGKK